MTIVSPFTRLSALSQDQIFEAAKSAQAAGPSAFNGTIGIIMDENGVPLRFESVSRALASLDENEPLSYPPINGIPEFLKTATSLVFGKEMPIPRIATAGGTGALSVLLKLANETDIKKAILPIPTWSNHPRVIRAAGLDIIEIQYLNDGVSEIELKSLETQSKNSFRSNFWWRWWKIIGIRYRKKL